MLPRLIFPAVFIIFAATSSADIIFNTYTSGSNSGYTQFGGGGIEDQYMCRKFTVTNTYSLNSLTANLMGTANMPMKIQLMRDNAGVPGDLVESISFNMINQSNVEHQYELNSVAHPILTPGDYYFMVGSPSPVQSDLWRWILSYDLHTADRYVLFADGFFNGPFNGPDITAKVQGTLVPEPASFAALSIGVLAFARRKKRK